MRFLVIGLIVFCTSFVGKAHSQPNQDSLFLSNLEVQADDPLYTTYAAHMERSEYALDEGYHFRFYEGDQPAAFTTDTGGNLLLVFENEGEVVYKPVQMNKKPTITSSYSDMVTYHFYPFKGIRVDATFQVYSSHQALLDLKVTNNTSESSKLDIHALINNDSRSFKQIQYHSDSRAVTFTHQELPDGWTISNGVPFLSKVKDVWLASEEPSSMNSYYRFNEEKYRVPRQVDMHQDPQFQLHGKVSHPNGKECEHRPPKASMIAYIDQNLDTIITHRTRRLGTPGRNIKGNGQYELALDNLNQAVSGYQYNLSYYCQVSGEMATVSGSMKDWPVDSTKQKEITLTGKLDLERPKGLQLESVEDEEKVRLQWQKRGDEENARYVIYRRSYPGNGTYIRMKDVEGKSRAVLDEDNEDNIYGYVVLQVKDGNPGQPSKEVYSVPGSSFIASITGGRPGKDCVENYARTISLSHEFNLDSGEQDEIRWVRAVSRPETSQADLIDRARQILTVDLDAQRAYNRELFSSVPSVSLKDRETELLYWSSFNMMRQVMLPPEGRLNYNYYVYSREPIWGWGHAGQVFHESLTMLAYGFMDPQSAMNSQQVYREVQHDDGYINYRTGAYFEAVNLVNGQKTTSAPWYAWQNWMLYKMTGDRDFLSDMYSSSKRFYEYYVSNRDSDDDGFLEWGGHAVLESVRDAQVAVWAEVDWPANFEAVDLNTMMVSEEKALANMAEELGKTEEAREFREAARQRTERINQVMWDSVSGFYYNVDKDDHDFSYNKKDDLKRKEIIGFLPLWAGVASDKQAERLVEEHLTNPEEFWRKYGVPSLSADDSFYDPQGYWNGPVWVEWNYLIEQGLLKYGYEQEARELVDRVASNMINRLVEDHNLWEFYSPDSSWGGHHKTYIWAGIINRMLIDVYSDPERYYQSR